MRTSLFCKFLMIILSVSLIFPYQGVAGQSDRTALAPASKMSDKDEAARMNCSLIFEVAKSFCENNKGKSLSAADRTALMEKIRAMMPAVRQVFDPALVVFDLAGERYSIDVASGRLKLTALADNTVIFDELISTTPNLLMMEDDFVAKHLQPLLQKGRALTEKELITLADQLYLLEQYNLSLSRYYLTDTFKTIFNRSRGYLFQTQFNKAIDTFLQHNREHTVSGTPEFGLRAQFAFAALREKEQKQRFSAALKNCFYARPADLQQLTDRMYAEVPSGMRFHAIDILERMRVPLSRFDDQTRRAILENAVFKIMAVYKDTADAKLILNMFGSYLGALSALFVDDYAARKSYGDYLARISRMRGVDRMPLVVDTVSYPAQADQLLRDLMEQKLPFAIDFFRYDPDLFITTLRQLSDTVEYLANNYGTKEQIQARRISYTYAGWLDKSLKEMQSKLEAAMASTGLAYRTLSSSAWVPKLIESKPAWLPGLGALVKVMDDAGVDLSGYARDHDLQLIVQKSNGLGELAAYMRAYASFVRKARGTPYWKLLDNCVACACKYSGNPAEFDAVLEELVRHDPSIIERYVPIIRLAFPPAETSDVPVFVRQKSRSAKSSQAGSPSNNHSNFIEELRKLPAGAIAFSSKDLGSGYYNSLPEGLRAHIGDQDYTRIVQAMSDFEKMVDKQRVYKEVDSSDDEWDAYDKEMEAWNWKERAKWEQMDPSPEEPMPTQPQHARPTERVEVGSPNIPAAIRRVLLNNGWFAFAHNMKGKITGSAFVLVISDEDRMKRLIADSRANLDMAGDECLQKCFGEVIARFSSVRDFRDAFAKLLKGMVIVANAQKDDQISRVFSEEQRNEVKAAVSSFNEYKKQHSEYEQKLNAYTQEVYDAIDRSNEQGQNEVEMLSKRGIYIEPYETAPYPEWHEIIARAKAERGISEPKAPPGMSGDVLMFKSGLVFQKDGIPYVMRTTGLPLAELNVATKLAAAPEVPMPEEPSKSFAGETDSDELRTLMTERFAAKEYGVLNDPDGKTDVGTLEDGSDWAAVQDFYQYVLKNNIKEKYLKGDEKVPGIEQALRIIVMQDFPIAGHHGTGGKGVGVNSAYIDWNVLKKMAENKGAYADYFASWLEHEYRERALGESHDALTAADALYKETFAFIKTVLHDNLKQRVAALLTADDALKSFSYLVANPAFVKERKDILAFSADLFADAQTFAELEVVLAELKLAGSDKEVWIRVADPAEREKFKQLEKSYPFLKVLDQAVYLAQLQKAKEKVIKAAFIDDKTMGDLDIAVPKPGAGQAVNAFSVFLAALSKDENIIKTVDKATMAEMLAYMERTNYNSPAKADYRSRMQDYKNSAIALISA